jgi:hypothetical protein
MGGLIVDDRFADASRSNAPPSCDYRDSHRRRRFYLDRGRRKQGRGSGSDLRGLMALPREILVVRPEELFGDVPAIVIGGVAARAYAPERFAKDIEFLVDYERFAEATAVLASRGWEKIRDLVFPNAALGLRGQAWEKDRQAIGVIATDQAWAREAFANLAYDQTGLRVIPLAYLVLMKLDSARGVDQGDVTRMLGRVDDGEVDAIVSIVEKHSHDPQAADDVRQYALLGRIEWETPE